MDYQSPKFQQSIELIHEQNYSAACVLLEEVLTETPSLEAAYILSTTLFLARDFIKAIDTLNALIEYDADNPKYYKTKFYYFYDLHQMEALTEDDFQKFSNFFLLEIYEKIIQPESNSEFKFLLSQIYRKMNNIPRMLDSLRQALVTDQVSRERIYSLDEESLKYFMNFESLRRSPAFDYPNHIAFETFAKCNAKCTFCVYPDMARQGTMMSMDLIHKIISDLQEIPRHHPFQLSPFAVNEPFLDKRFFNILDLIADKLPHANITLTSNASPINESNLRQLSKYQIDYLWLSVIDHRRDIYEDKMKLNYDRLIERLDLMHQAKSDGWFDKRIVLSRLKDNSEHDEAYINLFNDRYPLFETCLWPYANWIGRTTNAITSEIKPIPCSHWFEIRIDANGIVQHCCMDGHSEYPWGDVNKNSILEIYNQESYRNLRRGGKTRLDVEPCNRCNVI